MELEWWMKSPSPFTIAIWLILAAWLMPKLLQKIKYPRLKYLKAFADSVAIIGFITLIGDLLWCLTCLARFGTSFPFYPDVYQLILCAVRDFVGIIFCFMLIQPLLNVKFLTFNNTFFKAILYNQIFFIAWFTIAPNPGFIDWNFAIRNDYALNIVVSDFLTSHVLGRICLFFMLYNFVSDK